MKTIYRSAGSRNRVARPVSQMFGMIAIILVTTGVAACSRRENGDRLSDNQVSGLTNAGNVASTVTKVADPAKRCASGPTFELLKRELFRRAAALRSGGDPALFDRIATAASLRVGQPAVTSGDEGLGSVACTAKASLDLPPGLTVAGGRSSLSANVDYTLQPTGNGGGDTLTIGNGDAIIVPLATIARSASPAAQPADEPSGSDPMAPSSDPLAPVTVHRPTSQSPTNSGQGAARIVRAPGNPSFSCGNARTPGEIAICQDPGLAAIDRQMSAQYRDAYAAASPAARETLRTTARRFYGFRDNCPDARCIASGYRERMREIDDIMDHDR